MRDLYDLITVDDLHKDEASIIKVLQEIKAKRLKSGINLLNYYKELPINMEATVLMVDQGVVDLKVSSLQAAAMYAQRITFIKSRHFAHDVVAKVQRVNFKEDIVFLTQFSYVKIKSEQRHSVRVRISDKLDVSFRNEYHHIEGTVRDISLDGVAVINPDMISFEDGELGIVSFSLNGQNHEIPGRFLRMTEDAELFLYIIVLENDIKSERVLSKYVFEQQIAIINELKKVAK
jgi:hypothetical protein